MSNEWLSEIDNDKWYHTIYEAYIMATFRRAMGFVEDWKDKHRVLLLAMALTVLQTLPVGDIYLRGTVVR